jgi:hypothetical protein
MSGVHKSIIKFSDIGNTESHLINKDCEIRLSNEKYLYDLKNEKPAPINTQNLKNIKIPGPKVEAKSELFPPSEIFDKYFENR